VSSANQLNSVASATGSPRRFRRSAWLACALGFGASLLALLPSTLALEETLGLGALFRLRGAVQAPAAAVVVGISRDAAAAVGQTTELDTWPRAVHAKLVDALVAAGVRVIVFDLIFDEPREAEADAAFAVAMERAGNVLLLERTQSDVYELGDERTALIERHAPPLPAFEAAALGSAPFVLPTVPVRVGRFWTFGRLAADTPSLPAVAVQAYMLSHYDAFRELVERAAPGTAAGWPTSLSAALSARNLETTMSAIRRSFDQDPSLAAAVSDELGDLDAEALRVLLDLYAGPPSRYLNLYGPARAIATVAYDRALAGDAGIDLRGTVAFVGLSEPRQPEQLDDFYSVFSEASGINLSGVEIGATIFGNLLERRALTPLSRPAHLVLLLALGVLVAAAAALGRARLVLVVLGAGAALYAGLAYWLFAHEQFWLPLVVPLLLQWPVAAGVALWWSYRELGAQRERVRYALGHYVPQSLARRLAEQAVGVGAPSELLHGTCLVTDAEEYTTVAERLRPDELAALMNAYYAAIFRVVEAHGGEISDTAGDSMIAIWASVAPDAEARARAARAALAILAAVDVFNSERRAARLPTRVGLESGELLLGNIGAEQRYEYRAIGDIVNTAARVQGLNQLLGTRALMSATTLDGVANLRSRSVGTFLLRGKRLPVTVHEPLTAATALDERGLGDFAAALTSFREGRWEEARERFAALAVRFPADGPTRYYAALAAAYGRDPPRTWAGVVRVDSK
jgi:adenylate cyclase